MSGQPHVDPERLAELGALPADHPVRRHVEACERCRAAWLAYRRFAEPPDDLPAAELEAARAALHAAVTAEWERSVAAPAGEMPAARGIRRQDAGPSAWAGLLSGLRATARSPVFTAASILVVLATIYLVANPGRRDAGPARLRASRPSPATLQTAPPDRRPDGSVVLRWSGFPGADGYRVTLLSVALEPLEDRTVADTVLVLAPGSATAPEPARGGGAGYWQVRALRAGREVATSAPEPLPVP